MGVARLVAVAVAVAVALVLSRARARAEAAALVVVVAVVIAREMARMVAAAEVSSGGEGSDGDAGRDIGGASLSLQHFTWLALLC